MDTIRAFIAVEIAPEIKQNISELISLLKKSEADAKWITESQMHLTLKFLGNIDKDKIREISGALSVISNNFKPFTVTFYKIGAFPSANNARVIWLSVDKGAETLRTLNQRIESALEKYGFKKEDREFKPHLTLARVRSGKNIANLAALIKETVFDSEKDTLINKLTLFQSDLNPKGTVYTVILEEYLKDTIRG